MKQLSLDLSKPFPVHSRENNRESEDYLNENRESFSANCEKVLALLKSGVRLTVKDAIVNHGVSSLPRRILDLKQAGIEISSQWIYVDGKRSHKEWYILK